jgi:prepilin-type N-terminal cleavage/methylation domain-containing protein
MVIESLDMNLNSAFSLIELMVVIAIVAVLAAVAVPAYNDYIMRSKFTQVTRLIEVASTEAKVFMAQYGRFPDPSEIGIDSFPLFGGTFGFGGGDCFEAGNSCYFNTQTSCAGGLATYTNDIGNLPEISQYNFTHFNLWFDLINEATGIKMVCVYDASINGDPISQKLIPGCLNYHTDDINSVYTESFSAYICT